MNARTALITGVTGQDATYLAELLLAKGYRVCGAVRPGRAGPAGAVESRQVDLLDLDGLTELLDDVRPDEVYNLAAVTFVPASVRDPLAVYEFNTLSAARLLEATRRACPAARFFQAGSSEMF